MIHTSQFYDRFVSIAQKHGRRNSGNVSRASALTDLGLDSLGLMEVISEFEQELGFLIPDEDLMRLRTVGDFIDRVEKLTSLRQARRT